MCCLQLELAMYIWNDSAWTDRYTRCDREGLVSNQFFPDTQPHNDDGISPLNIITTSSVISIQFFELQSKKHNSQITNEETHKGSDPFFSSSSFFWTSLLKIILEHDHEIPKLSQTFQDIDQIFCFSQTFLAWKKSPHFSQILPNF